MAKQFLDIMQGSPEERIEALRSHLGYSLKQRDPSGSRFWYLRPGEDEDEAEFTCPVAVGFYAELDELQGTEAEQRAEAKRFLTSDEQQQEIHGHYLGRVVPDQPVMYLLLPEGERLGNVAMILPSESKLRQRQIQVFAWNQEDLQARLERLKQETLARTNRIQEKALSIIPLVEWVFYEPIKTAKELAQQLAEVSRKIEQTIPSVYDAESNDGYLHNLLKSFQRELLPALKLEAKTKKDYSFADIYAQTIAYGLFTARVFSYTVDERKRREDDVPERKETDFNRHDAWELLPETNPFLRRLFRDVSQQSIAALGDDLGDAISEIFSTLRAAKMDAILEDFRSKMNREDIVIRFYEDFLEAYKPEMRERRGVYYTPEPVVSYMVRSVDILLKEKFNKPLGLADPDVMILDPACGTGTFLLWIFQLIEKRFQENPGLLLEGLEDQSWSGYVKKRLLPRIFGFELLMAPYAIAHLKLGLFLEETGYQFDVGKRLEVFLTNSLDDSVRKSQELFEEFIAEESDQASSVKLDKPIMVVVGNPPYEGESASKNIKWINSLMRGNDSIYNKKVESYFEVDGKTLKDLGERNTKWLNNDYVKFFRFSQWRIENSTEGIVSLITDRSFLAASTFRGMRESLLSSFDSINILDLHGNVRGRRKDILIEDENVFEISQGTAVSFLVKRKSIESKQKGLFCADLWGKWKEFIDKSKQELTPDCKASWLSNQDINTHTWDRRKPISPYYIFETRDNNLDIEKINDESIIQAEYLKGWKITDIFTTKSMAITGGRDKSKLCPQNSPEEMWDIVKKFVELSTEEARKEYNLGDDSRDWKVNLAQEDLLRSNLEFSKVVPILFRPFDVKYTYFTGNSRGFHCMPRKEVMQNLLGRENIALCFTRGSREGLSSNFFVTELIADKTLISSSENASVAPLYTYPDPESPEEIQEGLKFNISSDFIKKISHKLSVEVSADNIFYYIYAILFNPTYRRRYSTPLKNDFAYIPLLKNISVFNQLSLLGRDLAALHLLRSPKIESFITDVY